MIPDTFINDLQNRVDLVEIIGQYVQLKKNGANFSGLCPFHNEKSPSFTVSPIKQFYHCFGCSAHGNAIGFLMAHLGLSFPDAVNELAGRVGMVVPENDKHFSHRHNQQPPDFKQKELKTNPNLLIDKNKTINSEVSPELKANQLAPKPKLKSSQQANFSNKKPNLIELSHLIKQAAHYYRQQLRASLPAIDYLKSRGLTGEIAVRYQLGYAPNSRQNLSAVFTHYDDERLIEAGLVVQANPVSNNKSIKDWDEFEPNHLANENAFSRPRYDRFRDRIIFPIVNNRGKVIAFGGRSLGSNLPKYLNSAETPLFVKGNELYGLFEARQAIREKGFVIVVEGYMDVIKLAQAKFENVVATLGTACTSVHIQKLVRQTEKIVFCFDGDKAGQHAAQRAMIAALPFASDNREFRFLFLPEEHDPDSFIGMQGADKFSEEITHATPLSALLISKILSNRNLAESEGRARAIFSAKPLLHAMPRQVLRMQVINTLASRLNVMADEIIHLCDLNTQLTPRRFQAAPVSQRLPVAGNEQRALKNLLMFPRLVFTLKDEDMETIALCARHRSLFEKVIQCVQQMKGPVSFQTLSACLRQTAYANTFEDIFDEILDFTENARDLALLDNIDAQKREHYENLEKLANKELKSAFIRLRYDACCQRLAELSKLNPLNPGQLKEFSMLTQLSIALKKELNVFF